MKRLLPLLFIFLFASKSFSQKVDTTTDFEFKNNSWMPATRTINSYNSSCLIDSTLQQAWQTNGSAWQNTSLSIYTYRNGAVSQILVKSWNANLSKWNSTQHRWTYTYNADNQVIVSLHEFWGGYWEGIDRTLNSYNADKLLDSSIYQTGPTYQWKNDGLEVYLYNRNGLLDTQTHHAWNVTNNKWDTVDRAVYIYNPDNTVQQSIYQQEWGAQGWQNGVRYVYTYNTFGKVLTDSFQTWSNDEWVDNSVTINSYSSHNFLINSLSKLWDNTSSKWINSSLETFINNDNGTIRERMYQLWNKGTNEWVNDTRNTYSYAAGCALPLSLLNFTAILNGKVSRLQWTTSTEINTKNFIIERSLNGRSFDVIDSVNAVGNSTEKTSYMFDDAGALNASTTKLYYRLQMVDKDGRFVYSRIVVVEIAAERLFSVYPNPVKDLLFITPNTPLTKVEVRITDQSGKLIYKQQIQNIQAGAPNKINVAALSNGVYYLQMISASDIQTIQFFKHR
jgi:hypothetical protein